MLNFAKMYMLDIVHLLYLNQCINVWWTLCKSVLKNMQKSLLMLYLYILHNFLSLLCTF